MIETVKEGSTVVLARLIREMADDLRETVTEIEADPHLTKGHYGDYLAILSKFEGPRRGVVATALVLAGADRDGVAVAIKLLTSG